MINLNINFPAEDVANINRMLFRYAEHFRGDVKKTLNRTMVKIITALRAKNTTMISGEKRQIVQHTTKSKFEKNTRYARNMRQQQHIDDYYSKKRGVDVSQMRVAKYAIERYTQKGIKYFPLFKQGGGQDMKSVADAKNEASSVYPKQYFIKKPYGKQGLAMSSWAWMLKKLGTQSAATQNEISGGVSVSKSDLISGGMQDYTITAHNRLNYIRKATKANISTAMARAATMMRKDMERSKRGPAQSAGRAAA
jgi:hypothetical protein